MKSRLYDPARDRDALHRIWGETGWLQRYGERYVDVHLAGSRTLVTDVRGNAECAVSTMPGTLRHLNSDIPMSCVTAVQTSRIARRKGLALRLASRAIADSLAEGAIVTVLGMFEQGYYNRIGFGTGSYVHRIGFDPAGIPIETPSRSPVRITSDDFEAVHQNRISAGRPHGACTILSPAFTHADMIAEAHRNAFGLGFREKTGGEFTHHVWISPHGNIEHGPYFVEWSAWSTRAQFRELMGVLRMLGDQVPMIYMRETHGIQLQDLADRPITRRRLTEGTKYDAHIRALANWQLRINDLPACMQRTFLPSRQTLKFNLNVSDPIANYLEDDAPWRGVAGEYVISLGGKCSAEPGRDSKLPTLEATIGAFSRLWLGVRQASALAVTDDIKASPELLAQLDWQLCLPTPDVDWVF